MSYLQLKQDIKKLADPKRAKSSLWFFKTGEGQYGFGDKFIGLTVPQMRVLAKKYPDLSFAEIKKLLTSPIHEERLIALLLLVNRFPKDRDRVYKFYLSNTKFVNNWDLVDSSADKIVGEYLLHKGESFKLLNVLAISKNIWERRIAMVATYQFIKNGKFEKTIEIAKLLLNDKHDLIHKAVGWMLREVGKRDEKVLIKFLDKYGHYMPRTALRYSIERFDEKRRKAYLAR